MSEQDQDMNDTEKGWGDPRTRLVSWYGPLVTAQMAGTLSGRELLQRIVDGRLPPPPIAALLGFRLVSIDDGEAVVCSTPGESVYNPIGRVHGGWLCTLLDTAAGCAAHTLMPAGADYSTIEIKVSFLKAIRADGGEIEVVGRALQVGRRVAFAEAHARNSRGDLVGHATASFAVSGAREGKE